MEEVERPSLQGLVGRHDLGHELPGESLPVTHGKVTMPELDIDLGVLLQLSSEGIAHLLRLGLHLVESTLGGLGCPRLLLGVFGGPPSSRCRRHRSGWTRRRLRRPRLRRHDRVLR